MSSQISSNDRNAGGGLDWRATISEYPLAFSAGALAAGLVVGYSLGGALGGASVSEGRTEGSLSAGSARQTSYASGGEDWPLQEGAGKPGLIEKFKNTQAFDRLQEELSSLGDRLLSELSRAGREIVLPALTGKIKELVGADVSAEPQAEPTQKAQAAGTT